MPKKEPSLKPWQIRNLINKVGCVQCGREVVMTTDKGHACCGATDCLRDIRRVEREVGIQSLLRRELNGVRLEDLDV